MHPLLSILQSCAWFTKFLNLGGKCGICYYACSRLICTLGSFILFLDIILSFAKLDLTSRQLIPLSNLSIEIIPHFPSRFQSLVKPVMTQEVASKLSNQSMHFTAAFYSGLKSLAKPNIINLWHRIFYGFSLWTGARTYLRKNWSYGLEIRNQRDSPFPFSLVIIDQWLIEREPNKIILAFNFAKSMRQPVSFLPGDQCLIERGPDVLLANC